MGTRGSPSESPGNTGLLMLVWAWRAGPTGLLPQPRSVPAPCRCFLTCRPSDLVVLGSPAPPARPSHGPPRGQRLRTGTCVDPAPGRAPGTRVSTSNDSRVIGLQAPRSPELAGLRGVGPSVLQGPARAAGLPLCYPPGGQAAAPGSSRPSCRGPGQPPCLLSSLTPVGAPAPGEKWPVGVSRAQLPGEPAVGGGLGLPEESRCPESQVKERPSLTVPGAAHPRSSLLLL